jgi:hypothetical protein
MPPDASAAAACEQAMTRQGVRAEGHRQMSGEKRGFPNLAQAVPARL